jgi:hypothetical protein
MAFFITGQKSSPELIAFPLKSRLIINQIITQMARSYKKDKSGPAKMKAYVSDKKQGLEKYEPDLSRFGKFPTRQDKLEAKNANRSLKKAVRQESKNDLKRFL